MPGARVGRLGIRLRGHDAAAAGRGRHRGAADADAGRRERRSVQRLRRAVPIILLIALLVALDVIFNAARFSDTIYGGFVEFLRVATRALTQGS